MKNYFITATDTDAGKTFVACAIAQALINSGKRVATFKPIAAGCQLINNVLINEDAKLLFQFANCNQTIDEVNPITFAEPIAPHIAAANGNRKLSIAEIEIGFEQVMSLKADINLTEGAGGWRLPLDTNSSPAIFLSDFAIQSKQDVILIVNMKLGCLNHALLTYQAIIADGLNCIAWVANNASDETMLNFEENIRSLEQLLPIPKIAQFTFYHDKTMTLPDKIRAAAKLVDCSKL